MQRMQFLLANANATFQKASRRLCQKLCNPMTHHAQVVGLNALIRSDAGEYLFFYAVRGTHMSFYRIKPDQVHVLNDDGEHFENMLESEYEDWGNVNSMSFTDFLKEEE